MPSVANVIGTDLTNYKIVSKNQFACNLMHVGRDERLPIALHEQDHPIIVSPAYFVFEIKPEIPIIPPFLMLWFKRPEFDRNAWFYTDADVRGGLDRDSFMDMRIPVLGIEEQIRIVAEYNAVEARIESNKKLAAKLKELIRSIYTKRFIDDIDIKNLPKGWSYSHLSDITSLTFGGDWGLDKENGNYTQRVLCIRGADTPSLADCRHGSIPTRFILPKNLQSRRLQPGDIVVEISGGSPTQSTGRSAQMTSISANYYSEAVICSNFCRVVRPSSGYEVFYYTAFKDLFLRDVFFKHENSTNGLKNLDLDAVLTEELLTIPSKEDALSFSNTVSSLYDSLNWIGQEQDKLNDLLGLLLTRIN